MTEKQVDIDELYSGGGTENVVPLTEREIAQIRAIPGNWFYVGHVANLANKSTQTLQRWVNMGLLDPDDLVNGGQFKLYTKERVIELLPTLRCRKAISLLRQMKSG